MEENKKSNTSLIIIFVIIALAVGVCGGYFLSKYLGNEKTAQVGSSQIQEKNEMKQSKTETKSIGETNDNEKTPVEDPITENDISNENKYITIINEYKDALKDDNFDIVDDKYPNINTNMVLTKKNDQKSNNKEFDFDFEYIYYDINKDGQDELVVFAKYSNNMTILDIYGYDSNNKKPVKIIDNGSLGYRASADIYNNGVIILRGSGGADNGIVEFTKILSNGYSTETDEYYYKYEDENTLTFYKSYENMENKRNKLSYTAFEDINNQYVKDAKVVNFSNLTRYKI